MAKKHHLSRSILLYYDRIGLLRANARSPAGYRLYSEKDAAQLQVICDYRDAGLTLDDIKRLLKSHKNKPGIRILESRLQELQQEMHRLRMKQATLCSLIQSLDANKVKLIDKDMWVDMLRRSGMNDEDMHRWHADFEQTTPQAHETFLQSLGISPDEIEQIRKWSRARNS